MEGLEDEVTRPRQVRYQAALRPDCTHSTPLPDRVAPCLGVRHRSGRSLGFLFCGMFLSV